MQIFPNFRRGLRFLAFILSMAESFREKGTVSFQII